MAPRNDALAALAAAILLSACTVTSLGPKSGPPRIESEGLIEGHAAFGFRDESKFLRVRLLDGESDGALAEIAVWKIFRLELGALGFGIGIGPFDLALGTLFYEPEVPRMVGAEPPAPPPAPAPSETIEDCAVCREAAAGKP